MLFIHCIFFLTISLFLCGDATAQNTKGTLTSTNYPSPYPPYLDTKQNISVSAGNRIKLRFTDFNVEDDHVDCGYDYLLVQDGDGTILLDKTCGSSLPDDITSRTNFVQVIFHSDEIEQRSGWRIEWQTITGPVCNCGMENEPRTGMNRISGGSFTSPNQYPWMVRLLPRGCGGSLISNRHVLTAKHCFYKDKRWYSEYYPINWVRVGVHDITDREDGVTVRVKKAVYRDNDRFGHNDIAILVLARPVKFDREIHPVCLPNPDELLYKGDQTLAMGWGATEHSTDQSPILKHINLTVYDVTSSDNYLYTEVPKINGVHQDPCGGDSGGPLLRQDPSSKKWTIFGTLQGAGYNCYTNQLWGPDSKGSWNSVHAHLKWIKEVLDQDNEMTEKCA